MIAQTKQQEDPKTDKYRQGEIFKDTKERLSKRTGIKGKQFEKIKFSVVPHGSYSRPKPLEDGKFEGRLRTRIWLTTNVDDILSESFGEGDQLGLDHVNKARNAWLKYESLNIR